MKVGVTWLVSLNLDNVGFKKDSVTGVTEFSIGFKKFAQN